MDKTMMILGIVAFGSMAGLISMATKNDLSMSIIIGMYAMWLVMFAYCVGKIKQATERKPE